MICLNQVILRTPAVGTKGYGNLLLQPRLSQVVDPMADSHARNTRAPVQEELEKVARSLWRPSSH